MCKKKQKRALSSTCFDFFLIRIKSRIKFRMMFLRKFERGLIDFGDIIFISLTVLFYLSFFFKKKKIFTNRKVYAWFCALYPQKTNLVKFRRLIGQAAWPFTDYETFSITRKPTKVSGRTTAVCLIRLSFSASTKLVQVANLIDPLYRLYPYASRNVKLGKLDSRATHVIASPPPIAMALGLDDRLNWIFSVVDLVAFPFHTIHYTL